MTSNNSNQMESRHERLRGDTSHRFRWSIAVLSKTPENNSNTTIHSRGHNASIELVVFTKSNGPLTTGWRVERTGAAKQGKALPKSGPTGPF